MDESATEKMITSAPQTEKLKPHVLRIAHLTTVHHPFDPRIFRKQLTTLAEAGFEAHLVAPHARSEIQQGVRITALPPVEGRCCRARLHPKLYRAARRLDAALYHFHDPELIPAACLLKRTTGARVIYDMHENYRWHGPAEGRLLRLLERWCFRWVDHVVVANPAQQRIPAAHGAPSTVVANYYKPPDDDFSPLERPPLKDFRLAYTGVMSAARGLLTLVDLAALFQREHPRWRLDLTGVCYLAGDRKKAEERIWEKGAKSALHRTGWDAYVPWRRIIQTCHGAHAGLVLWNRTPHHLETVPTKFYEYLSAGLPILCSDFPLWRRFVERHNCGAVVPPGDAEAAFAVLKEWTDDPARYRALAANARAAASQYQWSVMGRQLVRLYDRLLGTAFSAKGVTG